MPRSHLARLQLVLSVLLLGAACSGDDARPARAADLRFVDASLPAEGTAGHPFAVYAKISADAPKWNVTVVLALAPLGEGETPSDVDPASVPPAARVWSTVVEQMDAGAPVVLHEEVNLPADLAAGSYAAILQLEAVDFTAEDDALQGEEAEHRENNTYVAAAVVVVTRPALPDVELVQLSPAHHDVAVPAEDDAELLSVNVALEAKTHPVETPLALAFELGIPGADGSTTWVPLRVAGPDGAGGVTGPQDRYGLIPSEQLLDDGTSITATLVPSRERGVHLELYAPAEARAALATLAEATDCELRAHVDAAGAVAEHDEDDNRRSVWVRVSPFGVELDNPFVEPNGEDVGVADPGDGGVLTGAPRTMTRAPGIDLENGLDRQTRSWSAGNKSFGAGYWFDTAVTYGTADPAPIVVGTPFALYDGNGRAVQGAVPGTTPTAFQLQPIGDGSFRMLAANPANPQYPAVMSACRSPILPAEPFALSTTLLLLLDSPKCTGFRFVDLDGGDLESGDHVRWVAPNGEFVSPGGRHYQARPGTPANATTVFTIRQVGGDPATARSLRLVARGGTSVVVFGDSHYPLSMTATASLDLDVPDDNRFLLAVDVFDVTMLDLDPIVATEEDEVITLYSAEKELYSRKKSKKKKFLLAGFIPVEVTATATGTLGLVGEVTAGPDRRITLGIGPFVDFVGTGNAEANIVVADVGVHMKLRFVKVTEVFQNSLVLTDDGERRYEFGGELRLQSLDGNVYVYADTRAGCGTLGLSGCHPRKNVISWDGISKTYPWPKTVGRDL